MRLQGASLGVFVPGLFVVPQNPVTDAAGLGDFVAGRFVVPQNPVTDAAGLGDFVRGRFTVPQNPVIDARRRVAESLCGCGGGCGCKSGMGATSSTTPSFLTTIENEWATLQAKTFLGIPAGYAIVGGVAAVIILPMVLSGAKRRRR